MSSPAGFPPDHYLASPIQRGKDLGAHVPAQGGGPALLVPSFPSLRVEHQNSHLRAVGIRWRATVAVFGDYPLDVMDGRTENTRSLSDIARLILS